MAEEIARSTIRPGWTLVAFDSQEEADEADRKYWKSLTGLERLAAVEELRQRTYGYDPATTRLERVLEIIERE